MKHKKNIKINFTDAERKQLRASKIKKAELLDLAVDEIAAVLEVPFARAKAIQALATFQTIPSIGIKFAEDLVFLGYYSLDDLKSKSGPDLLDEYELKKGYWIDPCVEDQFRLVAHVARHGDYTKNWWDFTQERKQFRAENGYPANRPQTAWHEVLGIKGKVADL